jgi:hypothetical protein
MDRLQLVQQVGEFGGAVFEIEQQPVEAGAGGDLGGDRRSQAQPAARQHAALEHLLANAVSCSNRSARRAGMSGHVSPLVEDHAYRRF